MSDHDIGVWGFAIGIVGLVVTLVGFGVTIWQLIRTANASQAVNSAMREAVRRLQSNHMLATAPQLRLIEQDLDTASTENDKKLAIRTLVAYSHVANQLAVLLDSNHDDGQHELAQSLRDSATTASSAKATLVSGTTKHVRQVVKLAMEQIGAMSTAATAISMKYQAKVD